MSTNAASEPVRYADGVVVRIRTGSPAHHFRTPAYIQGHTGTVAALCGVLPPTRSPWPTAATACPVNPSTVSSCGRPTCGPITPATPRIRYKSTFTSTGWNRPDRLGPAITALSMNV